MEHEANCKQSKIDGMKLPLVALFGNSKGTKRELVEGLFSGNLEKKTIDQIVRDVLIEELQEKGLTLTSVEISRIVGIKPGASSARIRNLIKSSIEKYKFPVAANSRGYFWLRDEKQLKRYVDHLSKRIRGIQQRRDMIVRNYRKHQRGEINDN